MLCSASGVMLGFAMGVRRRLGQSIAIGSGAFLLGMAYIWWRAVMISAPVLAYPVTTEFSARITAVEAQPARAKLRLLVTPLDRDDLPPRIRLTASEEQGTDLQPGDYIGVRARLSPPPRPGLPGGYDFARRAWFEQLGAVGTVMGPVSRAQLSEKRAGTPLRARLTSHIHKRVDGSAGGIAAALVTGDRGAIADTEEEAMRRSGLAHLLSISGLHVTAVIGFTMLASLRLLGLFSRFALAGYVLPAAAAMAALMGGGYTWLAGAEVPTLRSFIAALLVLIAILMGREAITLRLVAAGAAILLLWRPEALMGASFQLSFAAVATIIALHELPWVKAFLARRDEGWGLKIWRGLAGLMLTGLAVEIALMPIGLFHFHKAGLYGALANIIAIPLTTFIIMPAEAMALALDTIGMGKPFWWIAEWHLNWMIWLAHQVANAPGSVRTMPEMPLTGYALLLAGGLWLLIWQQPWRLWSLAAITLGLIIIIAQPRPDLIISRDGRHVAARSDGDQFAVLRMGRQGYARNMMMEAAGTDEEPLTIKYWKQAQCNSDFCRWDQKGSDGSDFRILASLSHRMADYSSLIAACKDADIVISDRRMPKACEPKWLLVDRAYLADHGGMILHLGNKPRLLNVAPDNTDHPWHQAERVSGNDEQ